MNKKEIGNIKKLDKPEVIEDLKMDSERSSEEKRAYEKMEREIDSEMKKQIKNEWAF